MGLIAVVVDVASFWHQVCLHPCLAPSSGKRNELSTALMNVVLMPLQKLLSWYSSRNPVELWLEQLRTAEAFEDWEEAALHLDNLLGLDLWCDFLTQERVHHQLTQTIQEKQPNLKVL